MSRSSPHIDPLLRRGQWVAPRKPNTTARRRTPTFPIFARGTMAEECPGAAHPIRLQMGLCYAADCCIPDCCIDRCAEAHSRRLSIREKSSELHFFQHEGKGSFGGSIRRDLNCEDL